MDDEEWRQSSKYPEYYISSLGRVRRITGYEPYSNSLQSGYERLRIWCNKTDRYYSIQTHKLVAEEYLPVKDCNYTIRHKNGNTRDNSVSNLEWIKTIPRVPNKRTIRFITDEYQ